MNIVPPAKIVLLGFMSHFPVAGVAWQTIHYLIGLQRLGFDVYYVEAHGCTPGKLMQSANDDGSARAAAYISGIMDRFGLADRWAYHAVYEDRHFGLSQAKLNELYRSAALILNLHGSHLPTPELSGSGRLVYLETDPVDLEIDLYHQKPTTIEYLSPHCAFFTFGENLGKPDCLVPAPERFKFLPTRQPIVLEFWENGRNAEGTAFTTIGNWKQPWREIAFKGEIYRWSKHFEFQKLIDLPRRVSQRFELAIGSYDETDRRMLESNGWQVRHAWDFSRDLDLYRRYISDSRGEFTVAKDQNIRLRSGWFSDRAATYLAAGRPVVTQETGFSNILPVGEGLFSFSKLEEAVRAIEAINADYARHRRAARTIAEEYFRHDLVLPGLLSQLGVCCRKQSLIQPIEVPAIGHDVISAAAGLPDSLVVQPISRWPTRLDNETVQMALDLSVPSPRLLDRSPAERASIIILVRNGLAYTKMCVTALFSSGLHADDELIIVDNASTDGTAEYLAELRRKNPVVRVISNSTNAGFAAGNNQALAQAKGTILILLNNDTIVSDGWLDNLIRWLRQPQIGMVGPVTNRTCNEAQIDAPYRIYRDFKRFAGEYTRQHDRQGNEIPMLAMFCAAMRREVFEQVGPLDEEFELGMFEDDDYAHRLRAEGWKLFCADDVFVHHFGQGSLGELCTTGEYDAVLATNRRRFEEKWQLQWKPHGRRITAEYSHLRQRIREIAIERLPCNATVVVVSKGDDELLKLNGHRAWHFPQDASGGYANIYPAGGTEAVAQLETLRTRGADFLLIPKPALWWLEYYSEFREYLEKQCRLSVQDDEACLIYQLGDRYA
ncbi:MAG TPA: glycosyltransferase family 2 protein [Candidatus Limnocylindrales bacterium]|nr:glycosyltransferase family 2 protein [Candidatus Limnocylindrales bacterium]